MGHGAWGRAHRAERMGQGAWGRAHGAERIEHGAKSRGQGAWGKGLRAQGKGQSIQSSAQRQRFRVAVSTLCAMLYVPCHVAVRILDDICIEMIFLR